MLTLSRLQAISRRAWAVAGEAREKLDYIQVSGQTFDPATGRTRTTRRTFPDIYAVPPAWDESELNSKAPVDKQTTAKLLILAEDLPIELTSSDEVMWRGTLWRVTHIGEMVARLFHAVYVTQA